MEVVVDVNSFNEKVKDIEEAFIGKKIFFRGCSKDYGDNNVPGIFRRKNLYKNGNDIEQDITYELLSENVDNFQKAESPFEKLTIMQHYGLPTRLIDITENMLVALYFACASEDEEPGFVSIYGVENTRVKNFNNNKVHTISSLAFINKSKKDNINKKIENFLNKEGYGGIKVKIADYNNQVIVVKPKLNNPRIRAQRGAFLLFGTNFGEDDLNLSIGQKEDLYITSAELKIPSKHKKSILGELSRFGISEERLFPEIDIMAQFLKRKYDKEAAY